MSGFTRNNTSFLVGRPGLDPGTLGLKVQVKTSQHESARCYSSQKPLVRAKMTTVPAAG